MKSATPAKRLRTFPVWWLAVGVLPVVLAHWAYLKELVLQVEADDRLAHTIVLPIVSFVLLWMDSDGKYRDESGAYLRSITVVAVGSVLCHWSINWLPREIQKVTHFGVIVASLAAVFVFLYGFGALRRQGLAFLLLALSMPVPESVLSNAETYLQRHSANVAEVLFQMIGMSYVRSEMSFLLPGLEIVIARECSGLRSAIGIQAATIVGARVLFTTGVLRATFCCYAVPLAIVKNSIRICSLASMAVWVSPDVLTGPLHQYGGPVFTAIAAGLSIPLTMFLQRVDRAIAARKS